MEYIVHPKDIALAGIRSEVVDLVNSRGPDDRANRIARIEFLLNSAGKGLEVEAYKAALIIYTEDEL